MQPGLDQRWPTGDGLRGRPQGEGVAAMGVDVHLDRRARRPQRQEIGDRVTHVVDGVVLGLDNEGWRR